MKTAIAALIVAAGKGTRMGTSESKQFLHVHGVPILVHTLQAFQQSPMIDRIVLVVAPHEVARCETYVDQYRLRKVEVIVPGGNERQHSVLRGLQALGDNIEYVMIHDGVRPFIDQLLIERVASELLADKDALVVAVPVKDTIKMTSSTDAGLTISETLPRERLWAIQTPQAFRVQTALSAHRQAERDGYLGTDDAVLVERMGQAVHIVEGSYYNIKITTPEDLPMAEAILHMRKGTES